MRLNSYVMFTARAKLIENGYEIVETYNDIIHARCQGGDIEQIQVSLRDSGWGVGNKELYFDGQAMGIIWENK